MFIFVSHWVQWPPIFFPILYKWMIGRRSRLLFKPNIELFQLKIQIEKNKKINHVDSQMIDATTNIKQGLILVDTPFLWKVKIQLLGLKFQAQGQNRHFKSPGVRMSF